MSEIKNYIKKLFEANKINIASNRNKMFDAFAANEENVDFVNKIQEYQKIIMANWKLNNQVRDIIEQPVRVPNATVGKPYETKIDIAQLGWKDIIYFEFDNAEEYGLQYSMETKMLTGTPTVSGDVKLNFNFKLKDDPENAPMHTKHISFFVNADPKSLWHNKPSDKSDPFWKEDNIQDFQPLGEKHIVVASKRGRSHANVGSFRDDDYAFKHFANNGWSVVALSDGAGSSKASRKGSSIVCNGIVNYFEENFTDDVSKEIDELIKNHHTEINQPKEETIKPAETITAGNVENEISNFTLEEILADETPAEPDIPESNGSKISKFIFHHLGNAARTVHKELEKFADENKLALKDLHSTLIFALFKKYEFGYVILTFGVGDCPIGVLNKDMTEIKLMNWLDVGEFGGGTRFITMPEIFSSDKFYTRFGFKMIEDFSYLILMTDGIYDPKFVVEANLEKLETWQTFMSDLNGNNEDNIKVELNADNKEIASQLSAWMDFWSAGNHDDRTLAIIF